MIDDFVQTVTEHEKQAEERAARLAKVQLVSGAEMMQKEYPEPRYLWQGILPDAGLAVCASSKASGKTLLLLQLADAIARGRDFLDVPTTQAKTLFLELELSERRTAQRLRTMGVTPNEDLNFAYRWQQGEEGLLTLRDAIEEHGFELVIVDVLQMLWPMSADYNSYQDVYGVLSPLRQMANELGVMIVLVTHRRKMETADFLDGVMGSVGIVANADVVLSIQRQRGEREAILFCEGNDIESKKIALRFNVDPLGFSLSDASPDVIGQTPERREILDAMRELGGTAKPGQIATLLGKDRSNISHTLQKMAELGIVTVKGYGEYTIHTVHTIHTLEDTDTKTVNTVNTVNTMNTMNGTLDGSVQPGNIDSASESKEQTGKPTSEVVRLGLPKTDWPASVPQAPDDEFDIF
jgi:DNA-binding transcriptional ArsR family regulator